MQVSDPTTSVYVKPNRRQRRLQATLARLKAKKAAQESRLRHKYFQKLQEWLSLQPDKERADLVFKHTLKKLFKKSFKQDCEFYAAVASSIRHFQQQDKLATRDLARSLK